MGLTVNIETNYDACAVTEVELPEEYTDKDIKHIWVKWGRGLIMFTDGVEFEWEEDSTVDMVDTKRPYNIQVWDIDLDECLIDEADDTLR